MSATEVAVAATEQVPKEEKSINQNTEKVETTVDNNKQELLVLPPPEMIMATSTLSNRNAILAQSYNCLSIRLLLNCFHHHIALVKFHQSSQLMCRYLRIHHCRNKDCMVQLKGMCMVFQLEGTLVRTHLHPHCSRHHRLH